MEGQLPIRHQDSVIECRLLLIDYIDFYLHQCGYEWSNRPSDTTIAAISTGPISTMRSSCLQISDRYAELYNRENDQLPVLLIEDLTGTFSRICEYVFRNQVTWGRIFSLFTYAGMLAVECVRENRSEQIVDIVELMATYVQMHLADWIDNKGGWEVGLRHLEEAMHKRDDVPMMNVLVGVGAICGAVGAVALATVLLCRG